MKIVVLAGGLSTEREVSLASGTVICNTLRDNGHQAILVDTFLGLSDIPEDPESLFKMDGSRLEAYEITNQEPDLEAVKKKRADKSDAMIGPNVIEICRHADICYMGLHGDAGENGQMQAALDMHGIRYTGSGYLGSAVAMHKGFTKTIFRQHHVPTPAGRLILAEDEEKTLEELGFTAPVVVKICSGGSSIGVYIPQTEEEYRDVVHKLFLTERELLLEEYVKGREFAAGILAGKALPVIEIIPREGWFDYAHKYQSGFSQEITPAHIDAGTTARIQEAALAASRALGLEVYSRMDFLLNDKGEIFCLEANSLPGMTPASLIPKEAAAAGISYPELVELVITESMKKYSRTERT